MRKFIVAAYHLNVRDQASLEGEVIDILDKDQVVESLEQSANGYWQKISLPSKKSGWVSNKYLQDYIPTIHDAQKTPWMDVAINELGVTETLGSKATQRIVTYLKSTSLAGSPSAETDETPWCSAFVNYCMEQAGFAGTDSALARSWLKWGKVTESPAYGDIVIFERGDNKILGHVGFFISKDDSHVEVLNGNVNNKVCYSKFPLDKVIGCRCA